MSIRGKYIMEYVTVSVVWKNKKRFDTYTTHFINMLQCALATWYQVPKAVQMVGDFCPLFLYKAILFLFLCSIWFVWGFFKEFYTDTFGEDSSPFLSTVWEALVCALRSCSWTKEDGCDEGHTSHCIRTAMLRRFKPSLQWAEVNGYCGGNVFCYCLRGLV